MIAVARVIREHRGIVARTLRETFGVGISDLGDGLTWGEAKLLLEEASDDTGTALGAKLAGWAYRASTRELLSLIAGIGDAKAAKKLMPWVLPDPRRTTSTADAAELAEAQAALDEGLVFSS
ncbi:hypothetical protein RU09_06080 [Microbacterium sp. MEJ108Y]|uniref:hypothetical protein n=1 Tax=Microbacterium sp. MEJ108Y TaxID=1587523 RepID=UPI0005ABD94E|nr:hypothetical protein [Microbacterium sp. MEJ108Y]KIP93379.1 hypothetical protein RU09_06080 [Microbacterium sp. MEJ108Y]